MKKLTHIAALVAMTALLSACAAPGALDNLGPGGLAAVEQAVQDTLNNPGPGGLNPVEKAAQDALSKPGPVQQAVQQAVEMELKKREGVPLTRQMEFDFSRLDPSIAGAAREEMKKFLEKEKMGHHLDTTSDLNKYILTGRWGVLTDSYRRDLINKIGENVPQVIGVPVRVDKDPAPVRFETETVTLTTVGGDLERGVEIQCAPVTYVVHIGVDAKGHRAVVYNRKGEVVASEQRDGEVIIELPIRYNEDTNSCPVPDPSDAAPITNYIIVYSIDQEETQVAQYHTYHLAEDRTETKAPGLTIGKPACPPDGWPDKVMKVVEDLIGDCQQ